MKDYRVSLPLINSEHWAVEKFTVNKDSPGLWKLALQGRYLEYGDYTRLCYYRNGVPFDEDGSGPYLRRGANLIMSDTPAEQHDHLKVISQAQRRGGKVLIHGLGLGMVLKAVLDAPNVTSVDVVEIDQELIDLVGPYYNDPRLTIHQGDALTFRWPKGRYWDVVWHDIWNDICADNLPDMKRLAYSFGKRTDWQGFWAKEWIRRF